MKISVKLSPCLNPVTSEPRVDKTITRVLRAHCLEYNKI